MTHREACERLAKALDRLPGGFPETPSQVELRILEKLFSPEEAFVASHMTRAVEIVDVIAERAGLTAQATEQLIQAMLRRGLVWGFAREGVSRCRLAPFIVGIYEAQGETMDHELAHLCEQYWQEGGTKGIMGAQPALHRVIPAQRAVKTEVILPYDDIKNLLLQAKSFGVRDCVCRKEADLCGTRQCDFPSRTCLNFSMKEMPAGPQSISQVQALELLYRTEEVGLVHTVSNVANGIFYVCNCCGCCCGILKGITQYGIDNSVAKANYYASAEPERCTACGICESRCQVGACLVAEVAIIDFDRCIGCGLCVTGCPEEAITMKLRSDAQIVHPPENYGAWEEQRLRNRGLLDAVRFDVRGSGAR